MPKITLCFNIFSKKDPVAVTLRVVTFSCCIILITCFSLISGPPAQAQNRIDPNSANGALYVQQATTTAEVSNNSRNIQSLQAKTDALELVIGQLRDEVATQKGIGIGLTSVIGLLQIMQIFVQFQKRRERDEN